MKQVKNEIVRVFYEDKKPVAIMYRNGMTQFYRLRPMNNDDLDNLLEVDRPEIKNESTRIG